MARKQSIDPPAALTQVREGVQSAFESGPAPSADGNQISNRRPDGGRGTDGTATTSSSADRLDRIRTAAYHRAADRGFEPGYELDDWLAAERDVDSNGGRLPAS